jgi:hypothetical protein
LLLSCLEHCGAVGLVILLRLLQHLIKVNCLLIITTINVCA